MLGGLQDKSGPTQKWQAILIARDFSFKKIFTKNKYFVATKIMCSIVYYKK